MNKIIKIMTFALILLLGCKVSAQVTVTVYLTDNTAAAVEVDASGEISFTEDNLTVMESSLTGTTNTWAINDISKVTFDGDVNTEGIGTVTVANFSIFPNPTRETITISGIGSTPTMVTIYNVTGATMMQQLCSDGTTIDVGQLERGLYFVRVGHETLKLAKQ